MNLETDSDPDSIHFNESGGYSRQNSMNLEAVPDQNSIHFNEPGD